MTPNGNQRTRITANFASCKNAKNYENNVTIKNVAEYQTTELPPIKIN